MPFFTIHIETTIEVEADTAELAREHYEANHDRPATSKHYLGPPSTLAVYVTDENGEEV